MAEESQRLNYGNRFSVDLLKEFTTILVVYTSHLTPTFKDQKSRSRFYTSLIISKLNLDPKYYLDFVNCPIRKSFFVENVFPLFGKKQSEKELELLIASYIKISTNPVLFAEESYVEIGEEVKFINEVDVCPPKKMETNFISDFFQNFTLECPESWWKSDFPIRPRVVSFFCINPYQDIIESTKKSEEQKTKQIDRLNTKNKQLEDTTEKSLKVSAAAVDELENVKKQVEVLEKLVESLKKENEEFKKRVQEKESRKKTIKDLKKRLRIILENPDSKKIDEYDELQQKIQELSDGIPFCPISYFKLNEIKDNLMGTRCGHVFQEQCLKTWFSTQFGEKSCPSCRKPLNRKDDVFKIFLPFGE